MTHSPSRPGSASYAEADAAAVPARGQLAALPARLQALVGKESVSSFARRSGLAESVLRSYLREGRMPPLDKALAMAVAAGVSVDWLATGTGPPVAAQVRPTYGVDPPEASASGPPLPDLAVLERILEEVLAGEGTWAAPTARLAAEVVNRYRRAMGGNDEGATSGDA